MYEIILFNILKYCFASNEFENYKCNILLCNIMLRMRSTLYSLVYRNGLGAHEFK